MKKRALSPVITTVLLVLIAIILAIIIFLWAKGFLRDQVQKFGEPITYSCNSIKLRASVSANEISINNYGSDVPVYKIGATISGFGSSKITYLTETNFLQGTSKTVDFPDADKIEWLIPILLGQTKDGSFKEFTCPKTSWIAPDKEE